MAARATRGPRAWLAALELLAYLSILAAGFVWYGKQTDVDSGLLAELELAGSIGRARQVCRALGEGCADGSPSNLSVSEALALPDVGLIVAYVLALGALCWLGRRTFQSPSTRRLAGLGFAAAVAAGLFDLAENLLLLDALAAPSLVSPSWGLAAAAATVKFVLVAAAAVIAAATTVVLAARLVSPRTDFGWTDTAVQPASAAVPAGRPREAEFGVSLSGGGIRSGTTTLGVLQVLRERSWLQRADYLVSVSGGGYVTGALRLASQPLTGFEVLSTPERAFEQRSPELDHLRRHGRYLADNTRQWVVALVVVLRGVLASLGLLAGAVTVLGLAVGLLYRYVPLADIAAAARDNPDLRAATQPGGPLAVTIALAVAVVVWLVHLVLRSAFDLSWPWVLRSAGRLAWLGGGLAFACLGVPLLVWSYQEVGADNAVTGAAGTGLTTVLTTYVGALTAILWRHRTKVQSVWDRLRRSNEPADGAVPSKVSGGLIQRLVVLVVLLVLGLVALALLAAVISETATGRALRLLPHGRELLPPTLVVVALVAAWLALVWWAKPVRNLLAVAAAAVVTAAAVVVLVCCLGSAWSDLQARWSGAGNVPWWPQWWCLVVPAAFVVVSMLIDQTWMSMHPFYRRRLASAFSVRRVRGRGTVEAARALAYDFDEETTPLHTHADRQPGVADKPRVPHLIFAAAANLSGQDDTPPGRKATPFTFSHDWIGGPRVGYVRTEELHEHASGAVQADLTVQSAVAVSGAAFASAMGRQARPAQTLLALSNARLGTWLPNPRWLAMSRSNGWHQARMPRLRRVTYLLREVFGMFSAEDRLLYVTDGGHYENLGLIELLRHRVRTVVCVDAGGDHPPATSDIAEAITLAREELGVTIELDEPWRLTPGRVNEETPGRSWFSRFRSAPRPAPPPPEDLVARLSEACMLKGTVTYPQIADLPEMTGTIVVVKLRLTADMPYDLLSYAQTHPEFPYDSTGDQWFDEGQFNAFHGLGRHLGTQAADALGPPPG